MTNQPRPEICVQPDLPALCRAVAEAFVQLANAAVNQRGGFVIAGLASVPILNLTTPLFATAFMVHMFKLVARGARV